MFTEKKKSRRNRVDYAKRKTPLKEPIETQNICVCVCVCVLVCVCVCVCVSVRERERERETTGGRDATVIQLTGNLYIDLSVSRGLGLCVRLREYRSQSALP